MSMYTKMSRGILSGGMLSGSQLLAVVVGQGIVEGGGGSAVHLGHPQVVGCS